MSPEQQVALLNAAVMRANIRVIAMQAENLRRIHCGEQIAYDESAFIAIINEEGIDYNTVMGMVRP